MHHIDIYKFRFTRVREDHNEREKRVRIASNPLFPWINEKLYSMDVEERYLKFYLNYRRLKEELEQYERYSNPNTSDIGSRRIALRNSQTWIHKRFPDAPIITVGSYATSSYLPCSDMDITVRLDKLPLIKAEEFFKELEAELRANGVKICDLIFGSVCFLFY